MTQKSSGRLVVTNEERLRKALGGLIAYAGLFTGSLSGDSLAAYNEAADVYNTVTAGKTDMEKLREWLEIMFEKEDGDSAAQYGFARTLSYIATEFGGGE